MMLAHKIELRPNVDQVDYLDRACGTRRHCFNQLLDHFSKDGVKWSKKDAYQYYIKSIRTEFEWYNEVSARVSRNAIDDLDNAFKHFFRRCKQGVGKVGFPKFKRKGVKDSFAMRESTKFSVDGRLLRIEKLKTKIKMRQKIRFEGKLKQVTISKRAGKYFASFLIETEEYNPKDVDRKSSVGVDFGLTNLAILSDGTKLPANQKLRASLKKLVKRQRVLSRKVKGSNRRAKAKQSVAKLHFRIARQREATLHELSDYLTASFDRIVIEDLHVKGMVKNHCLARAVSDAGLGMLRQMIEYKAKLRGNEVVVVDRFFPSTQLCSACGVKSATKIVLGVKEWCCVECGTIHDRDINAATNLDNYNGEDAFKPTTKRTKEKHETLASSSSFVDVVNRLNHGSTDCGVSL